MRKPPKNVIKNFLFAYYKRFPVEIQVLENIADGIILYKSWRFGGEWKLVKNIQSVNLHYNFVYLNFTAVVCRRGKEV